MTAQHPTLADVTALAGVDVLDHLDLEATIPVSAGLQRQGDVGLIPVDLIGYEPTGPFEPVPAAGIPLVSSEDGGNTHLLVADGPVTWAPNSENGPDVGCFTVHEGATAYVLHPEHGAMGHAPGTYLVRRQVELDHRIVVD
ncbi:hypothetical protein Stsp02_70020 [Streptomyces sp. NBRC 14336]|uniref:hypothetical protein n=1 Tax=Streptomyces sp. NBRC 14336 TaxID=3030992 RepID=UPI0024A4E040|nr:hypothetical protein [Streptomyces sp. NBRC 14336]WBO82670.1 hypothetical protein SBE_006309 [Streptomyces sp. SBE_14.2]GLW51341.1 hypothetical protein Stsp02_70020 [Streptomyces sp. NBRC 14336]